MDVSIPFRLRNSIAFENYDVRWHDRLVISKVETDIFLFFSSRLICAANMPPA